MALNVDNIQGERTRGYVGKDGFFWWVGEVEDNEDPLELGRVKVRILGYYTNFTAGTTDNLPTKFLPWATVLQHTSQAGNDGQGESCGQLQPGAIVLGFFLDGEYSQMPCVMGVMRVQKSERTTNTRLFSFSEQAIASGNAVNHSAIHPAEKNVVTPVSNRQTDSNIVAYPGQTATTVGGTGSSKNIGSQAGIPGSSSNSIKPIDASKPIPAANGVGGPWKTLEYKLAYLLEDVSNIIGTLVINDDKNYIDLINGKLVTKAQLTRRVENYLGSIYAQIISAIRESLVNLAQELKTSTLIVAADGTPFAIYNLIQTAVTTILSKSCTQDAMISSYVTTATKPVIDAIDSYLESATPKSEMITKTVDKVVSTIISTVENVLSDTNGTIDTVKGLLSDNADAMHTIDAWEKESVIFCSANNLTEIGKTNLTGLMKIFITFAGANCSRTSYGSGKVHGWWPLFGMITSDEQLKSVEALKGKNLGSDSNDLFSAIFSDADQNVSSSKNYPNGAYDLWLGNPGRQGQVHKKSNGTTYTSVLYNNAYYAEKIARDTVRRDYPDADAELIEAKVRAYISTSTDGKGDTGALIADHISYAGNLTQEVHGDDCKLVEKNHALTVDGDYHLKITGNCHIEVGGGFYFTAEGAPMLSDGMTEVQKHAIKFGSDLDMNVVGAKFELQASELQMSSIATRITGNLYENSCQQQTNSAIEMINSSENSMVVSTPHLLQLINVENSAVTKLNTGIRTVIVGGSETYINPTNAQNYRIAPTDANAAYNEAITRGLYNVRIGDSSVVSHSG